MEDLLASQHELFGRISRTWDNLKKSGPAQSITVELVRSTLATLDAKWARFDNQHITLMRDHRVILKGHPYVTDDLYEKVESQYVAQRAQLMALERRLAASSPTDASTSSAPTPPATAATNPAPAQPHPRIEIPKFSGNFEDWPAFRDLFVSMVLEDTTLPNVRKLHYLKTSVEGEACNLIKNLPSISENFQRAWTTLKEHYENERLLVRSYLNGLTSLPKMKTHSRADLRKIFNGLITTVGAMEGIGRPINSTDDLLVHLIVNLLDQTTLREWERTLQVTNEPPTYNDLQVFLKRQITSEAVLAESDTATTRQPSRSGRTVRLAQQQPKSTNGGRPCPVCSGSHFLATCEEFRKKSPQGRKELVASLNRCFNCLGRHAVSSCATTKTCLQCSRRHHTSLHEAFATTQPASDATACVNIAKHSAGERSAVLLATIRMWVTDAKGQEHPVRALVDPGSETSLMSESLAQRLRLPRTPTSVAIYGIGGQQSGVARGRATLTLSSSDRSYTLIASTLILPRLSAYGGSLSCGPKTWPHVQGLQLADPEFLARDPVEVLLGADTYASIVMPGLRRGGKHDPVAQNTKFGWILLGRLGAASQGQAVTALHCSHDEDTATALRRFWEWEEPSPTVLPLTEEEERCEKLFCSTSKRLPGGRFQVRLPFRTPPPTHLADTKHAASRMLASMNRRFARDADFEGQYLTFMEEYLRLGHMSPVLQSSATDPSRLCYLPHHGVVKTTGTTTKLRVVFNGSSRTPNGSSLNDYLLAGPNLLPLLPEVILRWRRHQFAFVADIEKMYRQISVHPDDRNYQRILWKHNGAIGEYRLNTVTYGTACAPFLAIRVLRQLAAEEGARYPAGAAALQSDSYVDDILSGASSVEEGRRLQAELSALCMAGGFPLRKWAANNHAVLQGVPLSHRQSPAATAELPLSEHSVLGLRWRPSEDHLTVAVAKLPDPIATKRTILSQVARLFDPLGWLAPVVVLAKLLIQTTWLQQLDWDTPLAPPEAALWRRLTNELPVIETIRIPRWFTGFCAGNNVEVHGFSDASERAFGAVIYLRIVHAGQVAISLVQAKTKVAPLKRVSLPRLELCGAALLAKLSTHVREALNLTNAPTYHWTDSTVVLSWIRGHPAKWTTFVANRVAEIQRTSHSVRWRHVPGSENPADCASRGLLPRQLAEHPIWWNGPLFLQKNPSFWPNSEDDIQETDLPEQRPTTCLAVKQIKMELSELTRFSSLRRLLRVTSWMLRWKTSSPKLDNTLAVDSPSLQPQEIEAALTLWIRLSQQAFFSDEIEDLLAGRAVHGRSSLRKLTPFLDRDGVLRVGGRLKHAILDPDQRHPAILPPDSHLSRLIVEAHHRRTLHGGTQATLASIRQKFWLPRGRQLVKGAIHKCPICIRWQATSPQPLMGNLPAARVTPHRPFLHSGVDFAGPVRLRTTRGRGHKSYKGFLCIFVCFSSRAVHLEAVTDYTAIAFLAAFRRFTSRRGLPHAVYSDRGTNFVGADTELRKLFSGAAPDCRLISGRLADEGVRWIFNPPAAPHFGGLWEAAVRSVKHHLRRVIGDSLLTFEEMSTLLAEVEACLNSRPLQAITDDPEDVAALTPGHFLIGEPLLAVPEPSLVDVPANRLTRWRALQRMRDHFWARWSHEYLQALIPRPKWWKETGGLKKGQLCIIKDESTSPTRWPLARIVRLLPGADGQTRVVEVKTASGTLTRPVVKIVPLPYSSTPTD